MTEENLIAMIEAILFSVGEPVETSRIAQTLKILERDVLPLMDCLQKRYTETNSALQVLHLENTWQIGTKPEYATVIRTAMEKNRMQPLSNASMEVLTIIAYNQPASKGFIERVRGVNSSSIVNSLVDKGLLEEAGRIDVPGHPIGYKTTNLFLRVFGLRSLKDLPEPNQKDLQQEFTGEILEQDVTT
ncbi:MAG: SMC-Scp complex subunit ScpB [Oscillospiraceae bacterium]|nr:SMC-Scp complex subunit ScpB [Oscillospiraceae bacterium]